MESLSRLEPAFAEKNIAVCFYGNDEYAPWIGIAIASLCKHARSGYNYDIILIGNEISPGRAQQITRLEKGRPDIRIRMISMKCIIELLKVAPDQRLSINTYARLLVMSEIFDAYERILTLDSDLIVQRDIAPFFQMDMEGCMIAATRDCLAEMNMGRGYHGDRRLKWKPYKVVFEEMGLDVTDYFNAGVILWDLKKCREEGCYQKAISLCNRYPRTLFADQDILNLLFRGKWMEAAPEWNGMNIYACNIPEDAGYETVRKANIIHYLGNIKPWQDQEKPLADIYMEHARETEWFCDLEHSQARYRRSAGGNRLWRICRTAAKRLFFRINDTLHGWRA